MKKRLRLKNNSKKRYKFKLLFIFIIIILFAFINNIKLNININNSNALNSIIKLSNHNISYTYSKSKLVNGVLKVLSNINFNNPISILNNNYTKLTDDYEYSTESNYISDPYPKKVLNKPLIYIYNTHQLEEYNKTKKNEYNVIPNVLLASYMFKEKLNNNNLNTIVEETDITTILNTNGWKYYKSYDVTRMLIKSAKEKNPSLKYFIDIHRDSVSYNKTTITINDNKYAKVLFIIGLEQKNYQKNLNNIERFNKIFNTKYKGLSRGIYKKEGEGVNGIYNQDIDENVMLIEVGGKDNSIDEVNNTLEALTKTFKEYIGDKSET